MFLLASFCNSLIDLETKLKIGVVKPAPTCDKVIEDGSWVYVHLIARVEGREEPVLNTYNTKPMYFMVNNTDMIPGINIGLRGACEKEVRRITIPPELAYKDKGVDGLFGPYSSWNVQAEVLEVLSESTI